MDLLEDGEDGDRVDGHDQRREEERLQDAGGVVTEDARQPARVQRATCNSTFAFELLFTKETGAQFVFCLIFLERL